MTWNWEQSLSHRTGKQDRGLRPHCACGAAGLCRRDRFGADYLGRGWQGDRWDETQNLQRPTTKHAQLSPGSRVRSGALPGCLTSAWRKRCNNTPRSARFCKLSPLRRATCNGYSTPWSRAPHDCADRKMLRFSGGMAIGSSSSLITA